MGPSASRLARAKQTLSQDKCSQAGGLPSPSPSTSPRHRYRWSRPIIDEAALSVGRKPSDVATIYNFPGAITATPVRRTRDDDGRWIGGSPAQWIEELTGAVLNHNAAGFTLFPRGSDPYDVQVTRWSQEVVPAIRAAISRESPALR